MARMTAEGGRGPVPDRNARGQEEYAVKIRLLRTDTCQGFWHRFMNRSMPGIYS
jgi:hypothetical protein